MRLSRLNSTGFLIESDAASTRRNPFHIAVAAPEVSTGKIRAS
jgi:hypothetical protein